MEEIIARDYILEEKPDILINIVDATNIERNLYLTTQAIELGIPVVVALNMMDAVETRGDIAYAFMAFTLLYMPCIAAFGAIKREMNSWKWTLFAVGYQTGAAWLVAFIIYQGGRLLGFN